MGLDGEIVGGRHLFLEFLNGRALELEDGPADCTDKVIMMFFPGGRFITGLTITEVPDLGDAALREKFEGAIHGRITDAWVFFANLQIEFLSRQVGARLEEFMQDDLPLLGRFQSLAGDEFPEDLPGFRHGVPLVVMAWWPGL
jgi:hypothetical protein